MTFAEFRDVAHQIFDEIPPDYRDGVDGLEVTRQTVAHPSLPGVFTLGECLSEFYPSEYGGAGEVRSRVVLYYGSFLELSRSREDWDWEGELHETILHEVRHHLEHLAAEDELDAMDYAEDQNFARREGERFDPFFFQRGDRIGPSTYRVDEDVFIERMAGERGAAAEGELDVEWRGRRVRVRRPADQADVHYLRVEALEGEGSGEVILVLVRRRGLLGWIRGFLGAPLRVEEAVGEVLAP
jgi:predicted Zn-dependent protease with MMP-like domain